MDHDGASRQRLVLVWEVELEGDSWVNALLVADSVDVATATDVRLEPDETGLPFPVLVETDVMGPLFVAQLGPPLGRVSGELLTNLLRAASGQPDPQIDRRRGLPVLSKTDARWAWKDQELAEMHRLAHACMQLELGLVEPAVLVDPQVIGSQARAPGSGALADVVRVLSLAGDRGPASVELVPNEISEVREVAERLAALGPDAYRAMEPALVGALRESTAPQGAARWTPTWETSRRDALERRIISLAASGTRAVRVCAPPAAPTSSNIPLVHVLEVEGIGRVQVKQEILGGKAA